MSYISAATGVAPYVPPGLPSSRFAVEVARGGFYGTRDLVSGKFVPSVLAASPSLVSVGSSILPVLGAASVTLGVASVGLGIFNGVMSWKMNGKLNTLLEGQEILQTTASEILELVGEMKVDQDRLRHEVNSGFDRLIRHDLRSKMIELNDVSWELAQARIPSDAGRLLALSSSASSTVQSLLHDLPTGSPDRAGLVQALAFAYVASSDARLALAAEDPSHLVPAKIARQTATEMVSRELQDVLRCNSAAGLMTAETPIPVIYWGLRAGLQAAPVTQEAVIPEVMNLVWNSGPTDSVKACLEASHQPTEQIMLTPSTLHEAETLRVMQGVGTVADAQIWPASDFLREVGVPDDVECDASVLLSSVSDSHWYEQFEEDLQGQTPQGVAELGTRLGELEEPSESGAPETWLVARVSEALRLYDAGGFEKGSPLDTSLLLQSALAIEPHRVDLVDWAVVAQAEDFTKRGFPAVRAIEPTQASLLDDAMRRSSGILSNRAAMASFRLSALGGDANRVMHALRNINQPRFENSELLPLLPYLHQLEADPDSARSLYTTWIASNPTLTLAALAKARRAIVLLSDREPRSGKSLKSDFRNASGILDADVTVPRELINQLDVDFAEVWGQ